MVAFRERDTFLSVISLEWYNAPWKETHLEEAWKNAGRICIAELAALHVSYTTGANR